MADNWNLWRHCDVIVMYYQERIFNAFNAYKFDYYWVNTQRVQGALCAPSPLPWSSQTHNNLEREIQFLEQNLK